MKFPFSVFFFIVFVSFLSATIINVPGDQPTIQAGIDAAADTDTVLVADGTYFENIDFIGKTITVASNFLIDGDTLHIENTIINGSQPTNPDYGSVVTFTSNEDITSVITGFTLTEGSGTLDPYFGTLGGGIFIDSSSPSIISNVVTGNSADCDGGLNCQYGSNPRIINNVFTDNVGILGIGGLDFYQNCNAYFEGNIIKNNVGGAGGIGGINIFESSLTFINNIVMDNHTDYTAGGININNSSLTFINNIVMDNHADHAIGGIDIGSNSSAVFINCIIIGNSANEKAGGFCIWNSEASMINCTISGNSCGTNGGGIYCDNSSLSLINSILWNDTPQEIYFDPVYGPSSVTISYSDIQGGEAGIVTNNNGTVNWLEGNLNEDPLFVGTGDHPFSIQDLSPCINAGIPDTTGLNLPEFDLAGNPRVYGGRIDMGAYENQNVVVNTDENLIPLVTKLNQNYPNPFNPTTTINYQLPENSEVNLSIYNIKGQKVKTLVNEILPAGEHSIIWNGRDSNGNRVGSGIYFYKLSSGKETKVKKMLLLK